MVEASGVSAMGPLRLALLIKREPAITGTTRYPQELAERMPGMGVEVCRGELLGPPVPAAATGWLRRAGLDLDAFFATYPVRARVPSADVVHLTVQTFGILLLGVRRARRSVATVWDLIPALMRRDPRFQYAPHALHRLADTFAMHGLARADLLIAPSQWTKQTIVEALHIEPGRIRVVPMGVDHHTYHPRAVPDEVRRYYALEATRRYVLYVGSDDPRKNLTTLLRALAEVRAEHADVCLIKAGPALDPAQRRHQQALADELGVRDAVRWFDNVPDDDLPLLYNVADVFVLPSLYEGFGFPLLEAMACGTPTVAANATALPELAGEASALVDATRAEALAGAIIRVLSDAAERDRLRRAGLERASAYSWDRVARDTRAIYAELVDR